MDLPEGINDVLFCEYKPIYMNDFYILYLTSKKKIKIIFFKSRATYSKDDKTTRNKTTRNKTPLTTNISEDELCYKFIRATKFRSFRNSFQFES